MTNSDIFSGLSRGQFLSKTGNCQTYDNDADGCKWEKILNVCFGEKLTISVL